MNLALIGAGKWGQNYLRAIKKFPNVKIKYVCSGKSSLENIPSEYEKIIDYKQLAKKDDLDGIIICVPAAKHFELSKFFILQNKPILIEKPLAVSLKEAEELNSIVKDIKGQVMVGNIFLYNDAFQKFTEIFNQIKKVYYLQFEGCDNGPIRKDVSALWDWAPHDISMCLELLGKPLAISAWGLSVTYPNTGFYDMVYVRLFFKNNVSAFITIGWLSPVKKRKILAVGKERSLLFDDTAIKKIILFDGPLKRENIPYSSSEPLANELEDFVKLIKKNKKPVSDFNKSFSVVEIIDSIERSIKNKGSVVKL